MVLDVNMGVPLTDEAELLARAIKLVQSLTDLPICIDSSVVEALDAGLAVYEGKALVNSVTAEDDRMAAILPLVKRYGAAVIALPNDEDEIPMEADKRLELTKQDHRHRHREVRHRDRGHRHRPAGDADRRRHVGRQRRPSRRSRGSATEFGVNMTLGASNVSFGMPGRHALGAAFLPMAMTAGLTSAIMDARTPQIVEAVKAADLLLGHDEWGAAWIAAYRAQQAATAAAPRPRRSADPATAGEPASRHRRAAREGLLAARPAPSPATHDGTGRVRLLLPTRRPGGPRAARRQRLRRGQLERHRDRLHLRRPWHLQEVQGAGRERPDAGVAARRARVQRRPAQAGWRLACLAQATHDLEIDVPPLVTRPKAATVGVGRQVILRPAIQKRYVELSEPSLRDQATDLERLLAAVDDLELRCDVHALRRLPTVLRAATARSPP